MNLELEASLNMTAIFFQLRRIFFFFYFATGRGEYSEPEGKKGLLMDYLDTNGSEDSENPVAPGPRWGWALERIQSA